MVAGISIVAILNDDDTNGWYSLGTHCVLASAQKAVPVTPVIGRECRALQFSHILMENGGRN